MMEKPDTDDTAVQDGEDIEVDVVSTATPRATPINVDDVSTVTPRATPIDVDVVSTGLPNATPIDVDVSSAVRSVTPIDVDVVSTVTPRATPIDVDVVSSGTPRATPIDVDVSTAVHSVTPIDVDVVSTGIPNATPIDVDIVSTATTNATPIDVDVVSTGTPNATPVDVDVVDTPIAACSSSSEVAVDGKREKDDGKSNDKNKGEQGDGIPPDLVSSVSDIHHDPPPVHCPGPDDPQPSTPGLSVASQPISDSIPACISSSQEEITHPSPRRRSGSVDGTADGTNGNHGDRPRSGSMGQIEGQTNPPISRPRKTTTNFRIVDIVQLPRPRNPGGILGHEDDSNHQALDLIVGEKRGKSRTVSEKEPSSWTNPRNINSSNFSNIGSQTRRHSDIGSYGIVSTSTGQSSWLSSINEAIERPQPSSVVDNEGVAKKIARLDNSLISSSREDLWLSRSGLVSNVRTTALRTPPERPKVPRRQFSPLVPNSRTRPSPGRQRISPAQEISPSSETSRLSVGSVTQSAIDVERMSPDSHQNHGYSVYSPDDMVPVTSSRNHKCRYCNYSTTSYTQLQYHMAKHGGSVKSLKCSLCDYMTNEKSNYRRHRRLHARGNQATILKCGKCSYATTLPYKIREHYQQVHNDVRITGMPQDIPLAENGVYGTPHRLLNSRCTLGSLTVHQNPGDTLAGQVPYLGYTPLMMNGHTNTYPYVPNNRQPGINSLDPFINSPFGVLRSRPEGQQAISNYLRSIMPSTINSHSTPRQATSTLTSSDYFISPVVDPSHHIETLRNHRDIDNTSVSNTIQSSPDVKVKVEPIDVDNHSDVSSTANGYSTLTPDITIHTAEAQPAHQSRLDRVSTTVGNRGNLLSRSIVSPQRRNNQSQSLDDRSLNSGQREVRTLNLESVRENIDLQQPRPPGLQRSRSCTDIVNSSDAYNSFSSSINSSFKLGTRSVGIQCVLPIIKPETELNGDYFHQTFIGRHLNMKGMERGVQCNMNSASRSNLTRQQGPTGHPLSGDGSDLSEHHSSISGESRCGHCGIVFEDEVMFSIHIGCHSHTDPFICNICGKHCGNKYGFYSHIMRGHHF